MKHKITGIAATTGLFSMAAGALLIVPASAQQKKADYAAPPATVQEKSEATAQCRQGNASNTSLNNSRGGFRGVSFEGPWRGGPGGPGGGFDGPPEGGQMRGPVLDEMIDQLNLSEAQKEKVAKVLEFEREKMEALREQMDKLQAQTRTNLEAVLTAEQKQQLTRMESQRPGPQDGPRGGPRGRGGPGGGRGGEWSGPGGGPRGGERGGR